MRALRTFALVWAFLTVGIAMNDPSARNLVYAVCALALLWAFSG